MTIQFEKLKTRLLANPKVKAEYDALAPEFEIAAELLRARLRAGLSQAELAARMGTRRPAAGSACGYRQPDVDAPVGDSSRKSSCHPRYDLRSFSTLSGTLYRPKRVRSGLQENQAIDRSLPSSAPTPPSRPVATMAQPTAVPPWRSCTT